MATQSQLIVSKATLRPAARDLPATPRLLERVTQVRVVPDTAVLEVLVRAATPGRAVARMEAIVDSYATASLRDAEIERNARQQDFAELLRASRSATSAEDEARIAAELGSFADTLVDGSGGNAGDPVVLTLETTTPDEVDRLPLRENLVFDGALSGGVLGVGLWLWSSRRLYTGSAIT